MLSFKIHCRALRWLFYDLLRPMFTSLRLWNSRMDKECNGLHNCIIASITTRYGVEEMKPASRGIDI